MGGFARSDESKAFPSSKDIALSRLTCCTHTYNIADLYMMLQTWVRDATPRSPYFFHEKHNDVSLVRICLISLRLYSAWRPSSSRSHLDLYSLRADRRRWTALWTFMASALREYCQAIALNHTSPYRPAYWHDSARGFRRQSARSRDSELAAECVSLITTLDLSGAGDRDDSLFPADFTKILTSLMASKNWLNILSSTSRNPPPRPAFTRHISQIPPVGQRVNPWVYHSRTRERANDSASMQQQYWQSWGEDDAEEDAGAGGVGVAENASLHDMEIRDEGGDARAVEGTSLSDMEIGDAEVNASGTERDDARESVQRTIVTMNEQTWLQRGEDYYLEDAEAEEEGQPGTPQREDTPSPALSHLEMAPLSSLGGAPQRSSDETGDDWVDEASAASARDDLQESLGDWATSGEGKQSPAAEPMTADEHDGQDGLGNVHRGASNDPNWPEDDGHEQKLSNGDHRESNNLLTKTLEHDF